ncbi:MAG: hypothetical protein R3A52_33155, partial [Polyangiales bacterium]
MRAGLRCLVALPCVLGCSGVLGDPGGDNPFVDAAPLDAPSLDDRAAIDVAPDAGPSEDASVDAPTAERDDVALEDRPSPDVEGDDVQPVDAGEMDVVVDVAPIDTGVVDVGTVDSGPMDSGARDTGPMDTGVIDTGPPDTGAMDTGPRDTGVVDTGPRDTGATDTGPRDTGVVDSGPPAPPCPTAPGGGSATVPAITLLRSFTANGGEGWLGSAAVVDITGDGRPEVIVGRGNRVVAWNGATGAVHFSVAVNGSNRVWAAPVVGDVAAEAGIEVVAAAGDRAVVYNAVGAPLRSLVWREELRAVAGGDLDGDGRPD